MKEVKVKTQAELDAVIKAGDLAICVEGSFSITDNATVEAWGNATVRAWGNATVRAGGNATVRAGDNATVRAVANVFIRLFSALKITASASVIVMRYDDGKCKVNGGKIIETGKPKTPAQWCIHHGIEIKKGQRTVLLYKALNINFKANHNDFDYTPGTTPIATDWDDGHAECGGGLHFSPTPFQALSFNPEAKRFVACPVDLKDIVVHPDGDYPEKIKAKGCCAPVWECDIDGKPI